MNDSILLDYQKKWVNDKAQVKVMEKSRRIGITWAEAADSTLLAASIGGMDVWYVGYNKDLALEFINTCADWARIFNRVTTEVCEEEIVDEDKKILVYSITFESGYRITALSSRPSNLRGKQGKAIIDEAAFHDDLNGLMKAAMAFIIWGGRVAIISTHNGESSEFNDLVKDIVSKRLPYSHHKVTFMAAINDGLYERIASTSKGKIASKQDWIDSIYKIYKDNAAEELDCIPARSGVTYFSQSLIEGVMVAGIPVLLFKSPDSLFVDWSEEARNKHTTDWCMANLDPVLEEINPVLRYFLGFDVAREGDLSIVWVLEEAASLELSTLFVLELEHLPFSEQRAVVFYIINALKNFGAAVDATGIGRQIAEEIRQQYGAMRILEQKFSDSFYAQAMPVAKRFIEDRNTTIPKTAGILADFRAVKLHQGVPKLPATRKKVEGMQRHGDSVVAYVLAVWAREQLGDFSEPWSFDTAAESEVDSIMRGF